MDLPLPLRSRNASLLIILSVFLLSSLACNSIPFLAHPTATPTATSTPTPTLTPTRTSTPTVTRTFTPSLTPTQSYLDWPVVLSDTFDDNSNNWLVGQSSNEYLQEKESITDGQYLIDATAVKGFFAWFQPDIKNLADFYVTVDVEKKTGSAESDFGLVFRNYSGNKYYFAVSLDTQSYGLMLDNAGSWTTIINWNNSPQIKSDGINQLGVLAKGSNFTFFVNGKTVDQADDSTIKMGKVGVALELYKAGDKMELAFDNFTVKAPAISS